MRKVSAAIIICILMFNWFGYQLVTDFLQNKADSRLEAKLDLNNYDESQLIEIKVPVSLPYQTTWSSFERFDGEVEMDGIIYKYVKRKVVNDTLVLLCIPNHQKMQLQSAKEDFYKNTNDLSQNNSGKSCNSHATFKKLMSDYDEHTFVLHTSQPGYMQLSNAIHAAANLLSTPHVSPEQPPDFAV
ncbi:MAG: hypothetical protein ABJA57_02235 [Ginsengibacter sp.]